MKSIYLTQGNNVLNPLIVTAETELSFVAKFDFNHAFEGLYAKKDEGTKWFSSKESAEKSLERKRILAERIAEFEAELA